MKQARKISFIILFGAFLSCQNSNKKIPNNVPNFDWLVGNWKNDKDTSALFFEQWIKNQERNYSGVSYVLSMKDTVFFESIQLNNSDSGIYYSVAVQNQNLREVVNFKLISNANSTYIFENKKHDFPQSITYQYKAPDTLNAWITGVVNGKIKKEMFLMWRN